MNVQRSHVTAEQRDTLLERLRARARTLRSEIAAGLRSDGLLEDARETAVDDVEASVRAASMERDDRELVAVEAALRRMEGDSFGLCIECGAPLSWKRLEASPEASRCVRCENEQDRRRAGPAHPSL
jgi:DnaK suppressor protein